MNNLHKILKIQDFIWLLDFGISMDQTQEDRMEHSESPQTSKMELSAKLVIVYKLLNIFGKSSILDVWQGSRIWENILTK